MVTPAQAQANVRSATRVLAVQLGFYTGDGTGFDYGSINPAQQIALTNALASYITAHPDLFDTGAPDLTNPVLSAPYAHNTQVEDTSVALGDFADNFLANARAVNPLDPSNIGTVAKYVLFAAVAVAGIYVVVEFLPSALAKSKVA